ncbi:HNH endonuclease [Rhodoluna limnophila]|uniref:HNH endonuclease n=1 Tax=Rhodoluna limnophila TaxID=232537 RepID=UPI0011060AB2|nr:HNH endonuclease [Rhodoluna limnophila]
MHTLVLNAGYEPLAVVSFKRALMLVLNNKATILAGSADLTVHSANREFELPTVILLARYVRVSNSRAIPVSRRGVLRRDGHNCAYCGRYANTIDHVQPKSRGGRDSWENLVAACLKCNNKKGDKTLAEIGWSLSFSPKMPTGLSWVVRGAEKVDPVWSNYLALANAA